MSILVLYTVDKTVGHKNKFSSYEVKRATKPCVTVTFVFSALTSLSTPAYCSSVDLAKYYMPTVIECNYYA